MSNRGTYEYPAWCQMETTLDLYQQDRKSYLESEVRKLGPAGEKQVQQFNKAADALIRGVQELAGVDIVACLRDALMLQKPDPPPIQPVVLFDEHVCITLGWEAMGLLSIARERFWELLQLVRDRRPTPCARAFLIRVGRCYLFGFDAECVVMCRAALDRELCAEIADNDVVTWWKASGTGKAGKPAPLNLWGRIEAAHHVGRFDEATKDAANRVRNDGNKAVHDAPSISDPLSCIRKTLQVLDALGKSPRAASETQGGAP